MGHIFLHLSMGQIARICQNDFTIYQIEFNIYPLPKTVFLVKVLFCIFCLISKIYRNVKIILGRHDVIVRTQTLHKHTALPVFYLRGRQEYQNIKIVLEVKNICTTREELKVEQLTNFICIVGKTS